MKNTSSRILCLWLGALALLLARAGAAGAEAVSDDYATREWHESDGLPSEQIQRIGQDATGYLWVSTINGFARFDGAHFESYPIGRDGQGPRLIAATPAIGLVIAPTLRRGLLVLRNGKFEPWLVDEFRDRFISALFAEPGGALWIACDDGSLARFADGKLSTFDVADLPRARSHPTFATDAQGQVWIASEDLVLRFQDGEFIPLAKSFEGSDLRLGSSRSGGPWLMASDQLLRIENDMLTEVLAVPPLLGAHYVQALQEDRDGTLWIGTRSQGLHVLTGGRLEQVPTRHEDIFALCEDQEGNVWAGTNGGGLTRIRRKSYHLYDKASGLLDNQTHTVFADQAGDVWFANRDGGVARMHDGALELFANKPGWPRLSVTSVFPLGSEEMGVTAGLATYAFARDGPLQVRRIPDWPGPGSSRVTFAARNGDIWFSVDPDRVGRLRNGKFDTFGKAEGMTGRQIRGIAEDAGGRIWIGAAEGKLFRSAGNRFEAVPIGDPSMGVVQAIRIDDDGTAWLGTVNGGIVVLANGSARSCTVRHGLPDPNITQILSDRQGYLWFASKRGIFRLQRREILDCLDGKIARVAPLVIGQDEGLKDISCQGVFQPAACQTRDGRLWFATRRGVLAIDPAVSLASPVPPPVTIEEVRCDDQRVPLVRPFQVGAQVRKLEIRFGVLNLSAPDRVHAKYRLDGFDEDWVVAAPNRVAAYPRLPPGKYRFQVIASSGDGVANEIGDALEFRVEPQWWQTWWFRGAVVLLGALAIALAVRAWSLRRLRERLGRLEHERAIEQERRRIAQNIHDDLGASLTRISLLTQQARHEQTSDTSFYDQIHATAADITRSLDEIVWAVNPKYDDLESLASYVGNFAQNFLRVAGIRCRLDVPDQLPAVALSSQVRHHLFLACKEALNNVVKHAGADEVSIAFRVEASRLSIAIRDNGRGEPASRAGDRRALSANGAGAALALERRITAGTGIENMRRRMFALGGTCEFTSVAGEGATVLFAVPLAPPAN